MPSIYSKGLKWGTTMGSPWPSLVVPLMREERAPRLLLKLCVRWQSFWKQIAQENQGLGILLMHQNNCQQWTHISTWQPVARGQQLLTLIEVCPLTPLNSPLPPSTETECQLSFIILQSAHLFTYISCPAWVNMDCATPDLRPSSNALGSKFQFLSSHHILIQ